MRKPTKIEMSELISMFYRVEQILTNFAHVVDYQNVIDPVKIEKARKKLEQEYDK